jgi:hypothetical protein
MPLRQLPARAGRLIIKKTHNMKKHLSVWIAALVSACVFAGNTDEPVKPISTAVIRKSSAVFALIYTAPAPGRVRVSIVNERKQTVFSEAIPETDGFIRQYNFSSLPEGEYSFILECGGLKRIEKVSYRNDPPPVNMMVTRLVDSNRFLVSGWKLGDNTVSVRIYGSNGELLHREFRKVKDSFARVYRIERYIGNLTFAVTNADGRSASFEF